MYHLARRLPSAAPRSLTAELVRVSPDELLLFEPWMNTDEMKADAFVFCLVAADGQPR